MMTIDTITGRLQLEPLKQALKTLIVKECDKDVAPSSIGDEEQLIGGPMALDSLDALQICLAVKDRYGVRIEGSVSAQRALKNINSLAETILAAQPT
jgi:acyl carrier protein